MNQWVKRIRGAVGMGLTWAAGWALFGILIGVTSKLLPGLPWWDAFFAIFGGPLPAFRGPGLFSAEPSSPSCLASPDGIADSRNCRSGD